MLLSEIKFRSLTAPQDAHSGLVLQVCFDLNTGVQCHVLEGLHCVAVG